MMAAKTSFPQAFSVINCESQGRPEDTRFMLAYRVQRIQAIVPQLRDVDNGLICVGKFH